MCSAADIFELAEPNLLSLTALHIRVVENLKADFLSRHTLRQGEWTLNPRIFRKIVDIWGLPQIDLFATRNNRQVPMFASLNVSDHPDIIDSLQCPWKYDLAYAFPPMMLLPMVIKKIREEKAKVILIAPFWPKRPWFSCLRAIVSLRSLDSANDTRPLVSESILPSTSKGTPPYGVELERQILTLRGFSQKLINTLLLSRKRSTTLIYSRVWKKFLTFYTKPFSSKVPIKAILEFLQKGHELGLSVNTLRVQVSALGALYSANIAGDRWIARFIGACERSTPVHVPRLPPWDLTLVLDALAGPPFEPLDSIPLKNVTYKVALLIALTSARRVGDIQALSIDPPFLMTYQDRVVLKPDPSYLPKVATKYHRSQEIFLPSFYDNPLNPEEEKLHMLDVKRAVLSYIERTQSCRQSRALFVSFQGHRKGHGVTKATLSRWIREAIHLAYLSKGKDPPEGVKAH
ncbi:uncharacterized protein [Ranitomeya imitator]|uniref:uncharacterized protein n=1 Tax=Ranitomeya imitator TaxID=111125 RepID=UPI0037E7E664